MPDTKYIYQFDLLKVMERFCNNRASRLKAYMLLADIRLCAVLLSFLISSWVAYTTDVVNGDAVLYLSAAKHINAGGLGDACLVPDIRCWPLYPALIAIVGNVTSLGLEEAAYLLNAVLSGLMVFTFLTLVQTLGADRRTLLVAAFVILFHPYLNENRADIIRGHGYWAFYLLMLFFFVRYWQRLDWGNALVWAMSAIIATLFRIEGIVFLMLLPLVFLIYPGKELGWRTIHLIKSYTVPALLVVLLLGWWLFDPEFSADHFLRLFEPIKRLIIFWELISTGLSAKVQIISERVLGKHLNDYAQLSLWMTLFVVVASKIINTLTPLYAALPLFRRLRKNFKPSQGVVAVLIWLLILNSMILLSQIIVRFTVSGRYVVPLALTIMLVVPFALIGVYDMWLKRKTLSWKIRWIFPVIFIMLLFMAFDGVYSTNKDDKIYLRDAGIWLRDMLAKGQNVYTNDTRVLYYSGQKLDQYNNPRRISIERLLQNDSWQQYDLIAINTEQSDDAFLKKAKDIMGMPNRKFMNDRDAGVIVFSNIAPDSEPLLETVDAH